jgi:hypothetical protein
MAEQQTLQGRKLGDRRVVVDRPHARYFRYLGPGVLEAKLEAQAPRTPYQRRMAAIRGFLFGRPLSSAADLTERLPKWKALPIFSSDVMSSVAYAAEASLFTLAVVGASAFGYLMPISLLIVALLAVATARRSAPIQTAAAATSSLTPTWACCPGSSRPRRCWSTTS